MSLTKRQVVLKVDPEYTDEDVFFSYPEDDVPDKEALHMSIETWKEFGSPEFITITIVPGDQLSHAGSNEWQPRE